MSKKHSKLFEVLKILPTDYEEYGGEVKRWKDPQKNYPDCSSGCRYFVPLNGSLKYDWGVCSNKKSPRAGLLTWEHQAGMDCFEVQKESIVDFYHNEAKDSEYRTLNEIWSLSDVELMNGHDWVQWLFPLNSESNFNPDAPVLTSVEIGVFNSSKELQEALRTSFYRFLKVLGLKWEDDNVVGNSDTWVFQTANHNWLRFTRVIKSLTLLGLNKEAVAFYNFLDENVYKNAESEQSHSLWKEALLIKP